MSKVRISKDPNNTRWSKDTNNFGHRILRSHGWTPGALLGAENAPHASLLGAGSASYIRVAMKDDAGGLGYKAGGGRDDDIAGIDEVKSIFDRLNGVVECEEKKRERERRKALVYLGQKVGGITFVRGGLLVQDDEMDKVIEVEKEKERAVAAASEEGKRKAEEEESAEEAPRKKRRRDDEGKEERREAKKRRKEVRRERREKRAAGSESSPADTTSTPSEDRDEARPKKSKKSKRDKSASSTEAEAEESGTKRVKKSKKSKKSETDDDDDDDDNDALSSSEQPTPGNKSEKKKDKKDKKEKKDKKAKKPSKRTRVEQTTAEALVASGNSTPADSDAPARTSRLAPARGGGRHIFHARKVAAKSAAMLDAAALAQILAI